MSNQPTLATLQEIMNHVAEGKIIEAMEKFYDRDVAMQENLKPPCNGLAANIEREKAFLASVKEWKALQVHALAVNGDHSFIEYGFDFINTAGQPVHYQQVSVCRWKNGKIIHERFYYDTGH